MEFVRCFSFAKNSAGEQDASRSFFVEWEGKLLSEYTHPMSHLSNYLIEQLNANDTEHAKLVQKGLLLYRQGVVSRMHVTKDSAIQATVQDVTPVQVLLQPFAFEESTCECPHEGVCRHQMSVFFAGYSHLASPSNWLEEWKAKGQSRLVDEWFASKKQQSAVPERKTYVYENWIRRFNREWESHQLDWKNISKGGMTWFKKIDWSTPHMAGERQLYRIASCLYFFQKSASFPQDDDRDYIEYYTLQRLTDAVDTYTRGLYQSLHRPLLMSLRDHTRDLLLLHATLSFYVYHFLWKDLFDTLLPLDDEQQWVEETLTEDVDSEALQYAKVTLIFLGGNAQQALDSLKQQQLDLGLLFTCLQSFIERYGPVQARPLLYWFIQQYSFVRNIHEKIASMLCGFLFDLIHAEQDKQDVAVTEQFLISIYPLESNALLDLFAYQSKWRDAVDLLRLQKIEKNELSTHFYQDLKQKDPEALLPLYHMWIDRAIHAKNRTSYRYAVSLLRELEKLYDSVQEKQRFQTYLQHLKYKTKRLRAFQEELTEGLQHAF